MIALVSLIPGAWSFWRVASNLIRKGSEGRRRRSSGVCSGRESRPGKKSSYMTLAKKEEREKRRKMNSAAVMFTSRLQWKLTWLSGRLNRKSNAHF